MDKYTYKNIDSTVKEVPSRIKLSDLTKTLDGTLYVDKKGKVYFVFKTSGPNINDPEGYYDTGYIAIVVKVKDLVTEVLDA